MTMAETTQFCTFFVDNYYYGIEVRNIQEVLRYQEMTPSPLADSVIKGLINLRGQIVTAVDLRLRLGLNPRPEGLKPMNVIIKVNGEAVSLLVDEIGDVIELDDTLYEEPPKNLKGNAKELVSGVYKLNEQLMFGLDIEKAIGSISNN